MTNDDTGSQPRLTIKLDALTAAVGDATAAGGSFWEMIDRMGADSDEAVEVAADALVELLDRLGVMVVR